MRTEAPWAKIIAHSQGVNRNGELVGKPIITFQLNYPRFIHAEVMTHRVFSRNAASSRAIPVTKMLKQVWSRPAMPIHWGANQPGMQAKGELGKVAKGVVRVLWHTAAKAAATISYLMHKCGAHKQIANRITEPFQYIQVVLTSTEWENFFFLRISEFAQPEIKELAIQMRDEMQRSTARELQWGEYHTPYVSWDEIEAHDLDWGTACRLSGARCARVSYNNHDGKPAPIVKDLERAESLIQQLHASPFEHQATPQLGGLDTSKSRNLKDWDQFRAVIGI